MTVPSFVLSDRRELEECARRAAQTVQLAEGALLCRVLGTYLMFVDPRDLGVAPRLCLDGYWESWVTRVVARTVTPGMHCLDIGANHGYYTMLLADAVGSGGRVLAVEPNPALAELVSLSLELNGFSRRAACLHAAATDGAEPRVRLAVPRRRGACATICRAPAPDDDAVEVDALSVDEITAAWPRVDFIKVDAEGAEDAIWKGMRRTIARGNDLVVVMEFVASRYRDAAGFLDDILAAGFDLRRVRDDSEIVRAEARDLLDDGGDGHVLYLRRRQPGP